MSSRVAPVSPVISKDPMYDRRRQIIDYLAGGLVTAAFVLAMVPLVSLLWIVIEKGWGRLSPNFLTVSMNGVYGGMDAGGIYHAIVGTLLVTGWATVISVPVGIATAIYLVEYGNNSKLARATTFFVDVMTGIPSIVAGLFAAALFSLLIGPAYRAGIMGAVALSVLMTPTVVRSSEEMLRLVPNELREAAYALGIPKWLTIVKVVLRTAAAGLMTSIMLAIARVIGETAPLLMTVGVIDQINMNAFEGRLMTLPVYVYRQFNQGLAPCGDMANCVSTINYDRAWAATLVLILIVMILNLAARILASIFAPKGRN